LPYHLECSYSNTQRRSRSNLQQPFVALRAFWLTRFRYGPLFLPIACLLCLAAFGLAGTSMREFIADIPIALCLFILITAYSLPRLFPSLMEPSHLEYQIALEEGLLPSIIGLPRGPGSIQTIDDSHIRDGPLMDRFLQEQGFPYLTRSPSPRLRMPSIHGSDIDLEENMEPVAIALRRWVSPTRAEAFSGLSKISSPDPGSPPKRFVAQPSETPHHSHGYATSSVESNATDLSLHSTADPDSPLLQKGKAGPSTLQST